MILADWANEASSVITKQHVFNISVAFLMMVIGLFVSRRVDSGISRLTQLDAQQRLLFNKIAKYGVLALAITAALNQLGFDLRVLLGAAGVLTVAIGFAAQTSASNLISGFFLMFERPFTVGDVVQIGTTDLRGEVMSIDLLSTKIRTFTNLMVRVPNETLVKSNIINHSYFPVRRLDFNLSVSYAANLEHVESVLRDVVRAHPLCLEEPEPIFLTSAFGETAINLQFFVYTLSSNLEVVQNNLYHQFKCAFNANKIATPPFPVPTMNIPIPLA